MLTEKHIEIVKSTVPILENAGAALTTHFYKRLFSHHPELQDIFNMSNQHTGRQQFALFEAIAAYAKNLDNVSVLTSAVERIAQKHTTFYIRPEHYKIVGHHLIETLRELVCDAFTAEIEEAWTLAYQVLAQIFIDREEELYQEKSDTKGGWQGKRAFKLVEKTIESALVKNFIFEPVDQQGVIGYSPGQYLGIEVQPKGSDYQEIRQYSLSNKVSNSHYRISVKREVQGVSGIVSNCLHDEINVGDQVNLYAPAGDFFFTDRKKPVVLISAGVGITPMQAMLETLAEQDYNQPVHYLHACENSEQHSFALRTAELIHSKNWQQHIWFRSEDAQRQGIHYGVMDLTSLTLPWQQGDFYLCGPVAFMQFIKKQLLSVGVPEQNIHYEVFGPHASL